MYTVSYLQSNFSLNELQGSEPKQLNKRRKTDGLRFLNTVPGSIFILKSVLVPGLVKCLSVILQRTSFLMQVTPNMAFLIANRCLKSSPHPPDPPSPTETFFVSLLGFNFGLRSIHFKNPILKSQYYCGLLLGMSKKHNDLSLTL